MIRVGITGQSGFVGTHLFNALGEKPELYERIPFEEAFFEDKLKLRAFVKQCDVIVHLAAMMRRPIEGEVYRGQYAVSAAIGGRNGRGRGVTLHSVLIIDTRR